MSMEFRSTMEVGCNLYGFFFWENSGCSMVSNEHSGDGDN